MEIYSHLSNVYSTGHTDTSTVYSESIESIIDLGNVGSGEESVYAVQEFVDGDLVDAGGAGFAFDASVHIGAYEP